MQTRYMYRGRHRRERQRSRWQAVALYAAGPTGAAFLALMTFLGMGGETTPVVHEAPRPPRTQADRPESSQAAPVEVQADRLGSPVNRPVPAARQEPMIVERIPAPPPTPAAAPAPPPPPALAPVEPPKIAATPITPPPTEKAVPDATSEQEPPKQETSKPKPDEPDPPTTAPEEQEEKPDEEEQQEEETSTEDDPSPSPPSNDVPCDPGEVRDDDGKCVEPHELGGTGKAVGGSGGGSDSGSNDDEGN